MPIPVTINLYDMEEVRSELARRAGKSRPYSRQRVYGLVATYLSEHAYPQGKFFLTEEEVALIARSIRKPGRPKNIKY